MRFRAVLLRTAHRHPLAVGSDDQQWAFLTRRGRLFTITAKGHGSRVVTTKSIEIRETTAEAMPDFRYFLPRGRESVGESFLLPKSISLFKAFHRRLLGKAKDYFAFRSLR